MDVGGLARTLEAFPTDVRVAFEPRHDSWYIDEVRRVLESHGTALCLADRRGPRMPPWRTASWAYLRFHGGRAGPASCYGERALTRWTTAVRDLWGREPDGYAYFNNDHAGCALRDAATFARLLKDADVAIGRPPDVPDDVVTRRHVAA